jgi:hypothetical protein
VAAARNIAIILALAALIAFVPLGSDVARLIAAALSIAILASFVMLGARFYREHRMDLIGLGDRWRALLYGSIGVVVLVMAARPRLVETGAGTLLWLGAIAAACFAVYRVWRHHREYG